MSSFTEYKKYNYKKETPITWFYCAYCGKYQSRRTSKIKNPNLIFCDNTCRAKYNQKQKNKKNISNSEIKLYLKQFDKNIRYIAKNTSVISGIPEIYNDLFKLAPYVIYKCLQNSKSNQVSNKYFCKSFKEYLKGYIQKFEYTYNVYEINIDYYDNIDKTDFIAYRYNLDEQIDCKNAIGNILYSNGKKYSKIKGLLFEQIITNKSSSELAKKYNLETRKVVDGLSSQKKRMRTQYPNEYKYLCSLD